MPSCPGDPPAVNNNRFISSNFVSMSNNNLIMHQNCAQALLGLTPNICCPFFLQAFVKDPKYCGLSKGKNNCTKFTASSIASFSSALDAVPLQHHLLTARKIDQSCEKRGTMTVTDPQY